MNTKQKIINKINRIKDPELLRELDKWISSMIDTSVSGTFSKDEIASVCEGFEQYLENDVLNQEKANELFNTWLKGK